MTTTKKTPNAKLSNPNARAAAPRPNTFLGHEVKINNVMFLDFLASKGITDIDLKNLNFRVFMELITFCNPEVTNEMMETEINQDISFVSTIVEFGFNALNLKK